MPTPASAFPLARSRLAAALVGWILGVALQLQQASLWPASAYAAACVCAAIVLLASALRSGSGRYRAVQVLAALLAAALLGLGSTGWRAQHYAGAALDPALEGVDLWVCGVVVGLPHFAPGVQRFRLQVEHASQDGKRVRLPPLLELGWYGSENAKPEALAPVHASARWCLPLRLKSPHGLHNPPGFDYELWLWEQGVQATGYLRSGRATPAPQNLGPSGTHRMDSARQDLRDRILARVQPERAAALLAALVLGDQGAIARADWDLFRLTGVAHLVSISGLHITLFAWAAVRLLGLVWRCSGRLCLLCPAPHAALLGGVLLALAYALFSGWGVPAQRTAVMLLAVAGLRVLGLRWPWHSVWLLACALVLARDPWALLQPSFWLSFVAVGLLFASDPQPPPAPVAMGWVRGATLRLARYAVHQAGAQWRIALLLAPLSLLLFGQFSIVGLLANLGAIPWVTLLLTPLALLGVLCSPCWDLAAWAATVWLDSLEHLAQWPWASLSLAQAPLWAGAAALAGALVASLQLPWVLRFQGLPLLLPLLLWRAPAPPVGEFSVWAPDVGQGNAVLVRTATHSLLYDTGPRYGPDSDAGERVLLPLLAAQGLHLDRVLLSHSDSDHTGGAAAVLAAQPQAHVLAGLHDADGLPAEVPLQRCSAGQQWDWDGVHFALLHPQPADYERAATPNALSCVLHIRASRHSALLAGDVEKAQELRLLASGAALHADFLLVPHHGSQTSSSAPFLDAVHPRLALVQAGYRNRFGHPAPAVLNRYRERGILVHDSAHCGALQWRSDAPEEAQCSRTLVAHYWQHRVP